ncbi:MAG: replication initiator protein [Microvirus sp.]|nr:MAG: replication initiator protein [Microvirus sp.]
MACFAPLRAWVCTDGSIVFVELKRSDTVRRLDLPCGQCVGCRLERSRQWAMRCVHEASLYERNCFVTLTYDDEHLPSGSTLVYRDFQLFMKRLRKEFPRMPDDGIRFFMCGEYGEDTQRPHYHVCLFNFDFDDRLYFKLSGAGKKLYRSAMLERLWPLGYAGIGTLNFESAAYCARYILKKVTGDLAGAHYCNVDVDTGVCSWREPEFCHMSLKPGIGKRWLDAFESDVFPDGECVVRGVACKSPRYYDLKWSKLNEEGYDWLKFQRELLARTKYDDNTDGRLAVKARVAQARLALYKREVV